MMKKIIPVIAVIVLVLLAGVSQADTATFQQGVSGYTGCEDTQIRARTSEGWQNRNYGARENFLCAGIPDFPDTSKAVGSLVRFNDIFGDGQGQIPLTAQITSATLKFYAYEINGETADPWCDIRIYRMDTTWVEGTGDGYDQEGSSCANARRYRLDGLYAANPEDAWGDSGVVDGNGPVSGVDYSGFSKRKYVINDNNEPRWFTFEITPYLIEWQNSPTPNSNNGIYGFAGSYWTEAYFHSSEAAAPNDVLRPILEVVYETIEGEVAVFQTGVDGYDGCEDTTVKPRAIAADPNIATYNYGGDETLKANGAFESSMIIGSGTMIRFDDLFGEGAGQIESSDEIVKVELMLYAYNMYTYNSGDWVNVRAHQLVNTWVEGTAVGVLQEGSSCGEARRYRADGDYATYPLDAWGVLGQVEEKGPQDCDNGITRDFSRDGDARVDYPWPFYEDAQDRQPRWMNFDITEYVIGEDGNSGWRADANDNYGVYIYTAGGNDSAYFRSSEYTGGIYLRPKLMITYLPFKCGHSDVPHPDADITGPNGVADCYVDLYDFAAMGEDWKQCTLPSGTGCQNLGAAYTIPHGSVTVDANLIEWAGAEWAYLDQVYYGGSVFDINNTDGAKFALRWDANSVYAAVMVTDTSHVLEAPLAWNSSDRIEVYCQGEPNVGHIYTPYFDKAQQYMVGTNTDSMTGPLGPWAIFGDGLGIETAAGFEFAVLVDGADIIYEIGAKQFVNYADHGPGGTTVEAVLEGGKVIGFDIVASSKTQWGAFGMLSENMMTGKSTDARKFQQYTLEYENGCGRWGHLPADIDEDCDVDLADLSELVLEWLYCTEVGDPICDNTWM
ncbi:MAG: hypothetical protein K8R02_05965 [Anaerohalosphaeraceae bacterium]|nr:hypothetical protein [Anaerohalosphaeraceae bacterium]